MFFIFITVEHCSSIATKVVDALPCTNKNTDIIKAYFVNAHHHIFAFINYSPTIAFGIATITLLMSCAWNFMDVFIIIMSAAMTERYKQFNRLLQAVNGKVIKLLILFWFFAPNVSKSFLILDNACNVLAYYERDIQSSIMFNENVRRIVVPNRTSFVCE